MPQTEDHIDRAVRVMVMNGLRDKKATLWGKAWDIHDKDSRQAAADWFVQQLKDFGLIEDS